MVKDCKSAVAMPFFSVNHITSDYISIETATKAQCATMPAQRPPMVWEIMALDVSCR